MNTNNSFIFERKSLYLFSKKGNIIFSENENKNNNDSICNKYEIILSNIVKELSKRKNKNNHEKINFIISYVGNNDKIVILEIEKINFIAIGVFSLKTKTVIIKFYLLSFFMNFINYEQDIDLLFSNNINNNKINIYMDIYKSFLFIPFNKYFIYLSRKIFRRQKLKIKNIFYKNYYLIELNSDNIIFSLQSLYNINSTNGEAGSIYQLKIHKKEQIWDEILYHCHKLKNNYITKYSSYFNEEKYQQYYSILELKSTFPRRKFLIKFLPILNGLALIHEFIQIKLSSLQGNENTPYREYESLYGFDEENKSNNEKSNSDGNDKFIIIKNEPLILKKVNLFFVESFFIKIPSTDLFIGDKQKNIYYCKEIINIIEKYTKNEKIINNNNNLILKNIEKDLYEEFLMMQSEKNEIEMNSSTRLINHISELSYANDLNDDNNDKKISLNISKNFILNNLFKINGISKKDNILKNSNSQKYYNIFKDNHNNNKIYSNSKKEINKLSEILNDKISDYTGSIYIYNKNKKEENNININSINIFDNNSIKTSNIYDSKIFFNRDNSFSKEDFFNIDISNIYQDDKKQRSFLFNKNNLDHPKNDIKSRKTSYEYFNNRSTNKHDNSKKNDLDLESDYLGSKEEFFEGELRNQVK